MAVKIGISTPHYSRIENGAVPPVWIANNIVSVTRGAVRYRDLMPGSRPEYA